MYTLANQARIAHLINERMLRKTSLIALFVGLIALVWSSLAGHEPAQKVKIVQDLTYWPEIPNTPKNSTQIGTENACIYMLVRNMELHEALESIRKIEDRFNRRYRYPWIFLNDDEFTDEFKVLTSGMVSGSAQYGFVEPEVWNVPGHINKTKMDECIDQMVKDDVIYGWSRSYRNMCRYNSGNFFWHPLLLPFDWYWRVEPGIDFYCDQRYDPFKFLRENDKVYGFVITITEVKETISTLFKTVKEFISQNPQHIAVNNGLAFATDKTSLRPWVSQEEMEDTSLDGYNLCHFWSNFEIGSLNFFRSEAYSAYFKHLDQAGGFYYERWGDAPVHTLGLLALANITQIHHFSDIGYYHIPFHRCPHDEASYASGRCLCPERTAENVDFQDWSCLPRWWKHGGRQLLYNFDPMNAPFE